MDNVLRVAHLAARGMWAHRRFGVLTAWIVGLLSLGILVLLPAYYEGSARIFVNTESVIAPLMTGMTVQPNEELRVALLSRVLVSRPNIERLVQEVGLADGARSRGERERIIDDTMKNIAIKVAGRENIYTLTYRDTDPVRAKKGVAALAQMFLQSTRGGKEEDTTVAKKFVEEQIAVYEQRLRDAESRLKDFKVRNLGMTPDEGKDYFSRMADAERQLSQARLELREAERARDAFRRRLDVEQLGALGAVDPSGPTPLSEIDARLDAQRRNLDTLLQKFTEGHPDVVGTRRVIRELEEQRAKVMAAHPASLAPPPSSTAPRASETLKVSLAQSEASVASLSSRVAEYSERYQKLRSSAAQIPRLEAELAQLNRDYDVNKKNYDNLIARRESAAISGEMQTVSGASNFRLVDPPRVSQRPVTPNRRLLVPFCLLLALAAGACAAYLLNEFRPRFFDGRSVREVTGLPLLGVVSILDSEKRRRAVRNSAFRFGAAVAALVVIFIGSFAALELMSAAVV